MLILTPLFHADKFPSSSAFDAIDSVLSGSDSERKAAIKQANGVFAFTIKNKAGETESWHVDLKESGRVGKGLGKPTGKLFLLDKNITRSFFPLKKKEFHEWNARLLSVRYPTGKHLFGTWGPK